MGVTVAEPPRARAQMREGARLMTSALRGERATESERACATAARPPGLLATLVSARSGAPDLVGERVPP